MSVIVLPPTTVNTGATTHMGPTRAAANPATGCTMMAEDAQVCGYYL